MVIVGTPPQASTNYPPLPRVKGLYAITTSGIPGSLADGGFPAGADGGQVAAEEVS